MKDGVVVAGKVSRSEQGTPQGGVISSLLSNIFLHEVLDKWFANTVRPRLKGRGMLVRYADDFGMGFAREDDARRVLAVLAKRFGKYSLSLHPTKTRLVAIGQPREGPTGGEAKEASSYWGRSRKGKWVIKRKRASKWLNRRSRQRGSMTWERFGKLLSEHLPLPPPRVVRFIYKVKS